MNKFTHRELEKIRDLIQDEWDENTTHLVIQGLEDHNNDELVIGSKFTIKLESYIINQPPNFTLSENWNMGTFPPEEILDIEVAKIVGKMVGVKAYGKESKKYWEGWLPRKGFKIL